MSDTPMTSNRAAVVATGTYYLVAMRKPSITAARRDSGNLVRLQKRRERKAAALYEARAERLANRIR